MTLNGIPIECCLVAGSAANVKALNCLPLQLGPGSSLYYDAAYTNYKVEDLLAEQEGIALKARGKSNAKRKEWPCEVYLEEQVRKGIKTTFSQIKASMPRCIHATSTNGFLLKTALFIMAFAFEQLLL